MKAPVDREQQVCRGRLRVSTKKSKNDSAASILPAVINAALEHSNLEKIDKRTASAHECLVRIVGRAVVWVFAVCGVATAIYAVMRKFLG